MLGVRGGRPQPTHTLPDPSVNIRRSAQIPSASHLVRPSTNDMGTGCTWLRALSVICVVPSALPPITAHGSPSSCDRNLILRQCVCNDVKHALVMWPLP